MGGVGAVQADKRASFNIVSLANILSHLTAYPSRGVNLQGVWCLALATMHLIPLHFQQCKNVPVPVFGAHFLVMTHITYEPPGLNASDIGF